MLVLYASASVDRPSMIFHLPKLHTDGWMCLRTTVWVCMCVHVKMSSQSPYIIIGHWKAINRTINEPCLDRYPISVLYFYSHTIQTTHYIYLLYSLIRFNFNVRIFFFSIYFEWHENEEFWQWVRAMRAGWEEPKYGEDGVRPRT